MHMKIDRAFGFGTCTTRHDHIEHAFNFIQVPKLQSLEKENVIKSHALGPADFSDFATSTQSMGESFCTFDFGMHAQTRPHETLRSAF
jgi:hypothetical protein